MVDNYAENCRRLTGSFIRNLQDGKIIKAQTLIKTLGNFKLDKIYNKIPLTYYCVMYSMKCEEKEISILLDIITSVYSEEIFNDVKENYVNFRFDIFPSIVTIVNEKKVEDNKAFALINKATPVTLAHCLLSLTDNVNIENNLLAVVSHLFFLGKKDKKKEENVFDDNRVRCCVCMDNEKNILFA